MRLFVSYRRGDSPFVAGRLKDRMVEAFGEKNVFYDVDSLPPGVDFRVAIAERIGDADAVLAVIGPGWNPSSLRSETDYVRIELEQALHSKKRLVPILIEPTEMPTPDQLPESLEQLPFLNAVPLRPDPDFDTDVRRLLDGLESDEGEGQGDTQSWWSRHARLLMFTGGLIAVGLVIVSVAVLNNGGDGSPGATLPSTPSSSTSATEWAGDSLRSGHDEQRWTVRDASTVIVDWGSDGVTIDVSASAPQGAQGWIRTTCTFPADFVVTAAYDLLVWDPPTGRRLGLLAMVDDTHMLALDRYSNGNPDRYLIDFGQDGRFTPTSDRPPASGTTGELRLSRQSGHYTAQFRESGATDWSPIGEGGDGFTEPVSIGLSVWSSVTGSERAARFHDFVVESGTCES